MLNDDEDDNGIARRISKGYKINIHADGDGPDKFYSKPLIPCYKGKMQGFGDFAILGSHIYGFYNRVSRLPTRDVSKLRVIPHVDKEWIPSPMICRRSFPHASVIGGQIYVRNCQPYKHTDPQWGEVYDPVNEKWKAFPNPPNYPPNYQEGIVISAAVKNPDRIIVAYRVLGDDFSAIFYAYSVKHESWDMLAPARRKLHPLCTPEWLGKGVSAGNTIYWLDRKDEIIMWFAYDFDLDVWLEGRLKSYQLCPPGTLPFLIHLEKQRFCLLQCVDDYVYCVIVNVSRMSNHNTLDISVVREQKYAMKLGESPTVSYCAML